MTTPAGKERARGGRAAVASWRPAGVPLSNISEGSEGAAEATLLRARGHPKRDLGERGGRRIRQGAGIFSEWTNRTQAARVCSRHGPIGCRPRGYILVMDQSDAGRAGIFAQAT
eukprot:700795-Pyramimonas_sp.AAC.1